MNFIIKLSKFKKLIIKFKYNSIMIVVNKFTKRTYFISFHEKMRAEKVVYLFEQHIIANHEVLTEIISDRNMRFRSKFWQTLITLKKIKTKKVIYLFEWHIIANHKVFTEIISDKNMWFRSKFWQILTALKKIKTKINTTEHSQTNDQIKKLNQIMKQYLKCYMNYQQNNWIELLLTAQFTYNNST